MKPLGVLNVTVKHKDQSAAKLPLYVVQNGGPPLFGRDWLSDIQLDWQHIKSLRQTKRTSNLDSLLNKYGVVFGSELGTLRGMKARLSVKEGAVPKFCKPRTVPLAMRKKVNDELDNMVKRGILSPIEWSDWAAPIVPILKSDGSVRICGDFKVTVNPHLNVDSYPLPTIDNMLATMAGGSKFTKIDLKTAYLQMEVEDESKKFLCINTQKGLFVFNRMAYGIAPAAAIFQRAMEQVLAGIDNVKVILDDMVITGKTEEEHLKTLELVLARLKDYGLKVNPAKCKFFQDSVVFCAHRIDKEGIHKTEDKIEAVINAPRPQDISELRSWVALVNYYHRFLPNLSTVLYPLHQLLHIDKKWHWSSECDQAFDKTKKMIASNLVLAHYDENLPLKLHCDASSRGLGAVISHMYPDGSERPLSFASRSLSKAEKNYSQIDREALSIVWAIKKFHMFLFARPFTLVTDCKVLLSIFSPVKGIPSTAASRLQRWAIFLSGYNYTIEYRKTSEYGNADGLSRLPLPNTGKSFEKVCDLGYVTLLENVPVTFKQIAKETKTKF